MSVFKMYSGVNFHFLLDNYLENVNIRCGIKFCIYSMSKQRQPNWKSEYQQERFTSAVNFPCVPLYWTCKSATRLQKSTCLSTTAVYDGLRQKTVVGYVNIVRLTYTTSYVILRTSFTVSVYSRLS